MTRKVMLVVVAVAAGLILASSTANAQTQMQVYGLWHCYSDACSWASVPNMTTFDTDNHWILDRGNGSPSANLVVLSFVDPVKLMNRTNDSTTVNPAPECTNFSASLENTTGSYVRSVVPNGAGTTSGMLGYMFWAAECQGTRSICTTPPNTCEGGVGVGARTYNVAFPMPPLRQN